MGDGLRVRLGNDADEVVGVVPSDGRLGRGGSVCARCTEPARVVKPLIVGVLDPTGVSYGDGSVDDSPDLCNCGRMFSLCRVGRNIG